MAPLSYSLLTDVLQYTPTKPETVKASVLPLDKPEQVYQNTNIITPNKELVKRHIENFEDQNDTLKHLKLMEEQVFLSKLILLLLGFILIVGILEKK